MKEILNRDIKERDIIIVKPTGKESHGLHIATIFEGEVLLRRYKGGTPYKTSYGECFLIVNPTDEEKMVANKLIEDILANRIEKENDKKLAKLSYVKRKDLKIYDLTDRGVFLGSVEVNGEIYKNAFLTVIRRLDGSIVLYNHYKEPYLDVIQSFPRINKVDNKFTIDDIKLAMARHREYRKGWSKWIVPTIKVLATGDVL